MPTDFIGLFALLAAGRVRFVLVGGCEVRVASIEHLIRLKAAAGRPQDLAVIERLRAKLRG